MDARRPQVLTLRVRSLERSVGFYRDVLGVPLKLRTQGYAEMQTETVLLALIEDERAEPPGPTPALGWEVEDLDAEARALEDRGLAVERGPEVGAAVAGRRLAVHDPDGHRLELIQYPTP